MADITYLHAMTDLPLPVARVLDAAKTCTSVLVLGENADGTMYCAASTSDTRAHLWWMEWFKHALLRGDFD